MRRTVWSVVVVVVVGTAAATTILAGGAAVAQAAESAPATPDPGAILFAERCAACHNLGGGPKVGPDLLGVVKRRDRAWVARFVRGPSRMIDSGDPVAAELFRTFTPVRMPDQPLTDAEVGAVWAYFGACTDKGGCQPVALGPRWGTDGTDEEIARGRGLFLGERHLQKGGAACFACHNIRGEGVMGGGTLGPDLTFAYARLGEKGTPSFLNMVETTSPVMRQVYATSPLDDGEQYALKAYLAHVARDGSPPRHERNFLLIGLEGMGLVLGAVTLRSGGRRGGRLRAPGSASDGVKQKASGEGTAAADRERTS
jgi:mono/diheme cytochrome c family protein